MGTSLDLFDALKVISGYMDLPQEIKDMLPALVDTAGTVISYGDLDTKSSQELKDMMDLPFVDEQPPGEPLELDEELIGEEIVIWVLEKHNSDLVRDGEAVRVSGILAEFSDYDVVLKDGRCSGSCSVVKQMDGSVIVEREKIISIRRA